MFTDDDGTPYLVFGVWDYYIARLNDDMISLAEPPRRITIHDPEGPYGKGKLDDKPYLHKRAGVCYLSWGCYYGMSDRAHGPFVCRGSVIQEAYVDEPLRYTHAALTYDRHGSFFQLRGQWYYICNDMSQTRTEFFRDSSIGYLFYRDNGEIEPVRLTTAGVALP